MKGHTGVLENGQALGNQFVCSLGDLRNRLLQSVKGLHTNDTPLCGRLQIYIASAVVGNPDQPGRAKQEHVLMCFREQFPYSSPKEAQR